MVPTTSRMTPLAEATHQADGEQAEAFVHNMLAGFALQTESQASWGYLVVSSPSH